MHTNLLAATWFSNHYDSDEKVTLWPYVCIYDLHKFVKGSLKSHREHLVTVLFNNQIASPNCGQ